MGRIVDESGYLRALTRRACVPYLRVPGIRAILSIGSAAEGCADRFSDVDVALYYDHLPSQAEFDAAMRANRASERNWGVFQPEQGQAIESYPVCGVECQFAHSTLEAWEREMDSVLVRHEVKSPVQKALSGVLAGEPLYGADLLREYRSRVADYPEELAAAMVREYLSFPPLWLLESRLESRDAQLWTQESLVQGVQNLLGVLAGLNRLYYSTFQFKRMAKFVDAMAIRPPDLYYRIGRIFDSDSPLVRYKSLVEDTVGLVEVHMPEVDLGAVRASLRGRERPWEPDPDLMAEAGLWLR